MCIILTRKDRIVFEGWVLIGVWRVLLRVWDSQKVVEEWQVPEAQAALNSSLSDPPPVGANLSLLHLMTKLQTWEMNGVPKAHGERRTLISPAPCAWFTGIRVETWFLRCFKLY